MTWMRSSSPCIKIEARGNWGLGNVCKPSCMRCQFVLLSQYLWPPVLSGTGSW